MTGLRLPLATSTSTEPSTENSEEGAAFFPSLLLSYSSLAGSFNILFFFGLVSDEVNARLRGYEATLHLIQLHLSTETTEGRHGANETPIFP